MPKPHLIVTHLARLISSGLSTATTWIRRCSSPIVLVARDQQPRLALGDPASWLPLFVESLIYIVAVLSLRETLNCLVYDDDLVDSLTRGGPFFGGVTARNFLQFILKRLATEIRVGRIMIGIFPTFIVALFLDTFQYRIYVLLLVCADIWLFGKCVYQWTSSYRLKWSAMAFSILCFQLHFQFHHPILNYFGLVPFLLLILLSSMFFFWRHCTQNSKGSLVLSGLFYLWGLTSYEVSFVFIFILFLLAYLATRNLVASLLRSWLHLTLIGVFVVVNMLVRSHDGYAGASFSSNGWAILPTTLKQVTATFPLSNLVAATWPHPGPILPRLLSLGSVSVGDFLTVGCFLIVLWIIRRTEEASPGVDAGGARILAGVGSLMVLLPAGLIGMSARYQKEVSFGVGHIPVYVQYFGLALLFALLYSFARARLKVYWIRPLNVLLVLASAIILLANQQYARAATLSINSTLYGKMLALQYSLEDGLVKDLPGDSLIVNFQVVPTYLPTSEYSSRFIANYAQRHFDSVQHANDFAHSILADCSTRGASSGVINYAPTRPTYAIRSNGDPIRGVVYLGRVKNMIINLNRTEITGYEVDKLRIYATRAVAAKHVSFNEKTDRLEHVRRDALLISSANGSQARGQVYDFDFPGGLVDFSTSNIVQDLGHATSGL